MTTARRYRGRRGTRRGGFTLLEIVLALAIAGIAMALLSQLVGLANRSAAASRDLTKAQLIAESIMAEYASGVMLPQESSGTWELDPTWIYSVAVSPGSSENLSVITVTVTHDVDTPTPTSFSLTQWMFIPPEPEEDATEADSGAGTTSDESSGGTA